MFGEEVYFLTGNNQWQLATVIGTRDTGRSYDIVPPEGTSLRRNRSHLKPRCFDIPIINKNFTFRTTTPSQSEIYNRTEKQLAGPAHPPKVKYSTENDLSGPAHPPKVKYSQSVPKITIKRVSDTAYDSYIFSGF